MSIKLIATDMDGTLLDSNKKMPGGLFEWIEDHKDIKFVIASGRQYYTLKKDFLPVHDDMVYIADNGALVYENDEVMFIDEMKYEDVEFCLDLVEKIKGTKVIVCGVESAYMTAPDEEENRNAGMYYERLKVVDNLKEAAKKDRIVKLAVYFRNYSAEENFHIFDVIPEHLTAVVSGVSWIDIANHSVNKGSAVSVIQEKLNIKREECMAFGDYLNDIELLQACEESYAMANAHDDIKKLAKHMAPSNDEDGVMTILRKF